jgi:rhodanese-related sulfurtransferase
LSAQSIDVIAFGSKLRPYAVFILLFMTFAPVEPEGILKMHSPDRAFSRHVKVSVFVSLTLLLTSQAKAQGTARPIEAAQLQAYVQKTATTVLDVRMPGDCPEAFQFKRAHLAISYDHTQPEGDARAMSDETFLSAVRRRLGPKARTLVVLCCAGGRAEAAARTLARHGFTALYVPGGTQNPAIPAALLKQ